MNDYFWIPIAIAASVFVIWLVIRQKRKRAEEKAPAKNSPIVKKNGERLDVSDYGRITNYTDKGAEFWTPYKLPDLHFEWIKRLMDNGLDEGFASVKGGTDDDGNSYPADTMRHDTFTRANKRVFLLIDEIWNAPSGTPGLKVLSGLTGTTEILTAGTVIGGGSQWSVFGNYHPFRLVCLPLLNPEEYGKYAEYFEDAVRHEAIDHSWTADHDPKYHLKRMQSEMHPFHPKKAKRITAQLKESEVDCVTCKPDYVLHGIQNPKES